MHAEASQKWIAPEQRYGDRSRIRARPRSVSHQLGGRILTGKNAAELARKVGTWPNPRRVSAKGPGFQSTMLATYGRMEARRTRFLRHSRYPLTAAGRSALCGGSLVAELFRPCFRGSLSPRACGGAGLGPAPFLTRIIQYCLASRARLVFFP